MPAELLRHRLIVRLAGEIGTKSTSTRRRFLRVLIHNLKRAWHDARVRVRVHPEWSHLLVDTDRPQAAREAAACVFGVSEIAEVTEVPFGALEDLVARVAPLFRDAVAGRKFAVRASRTGTHPFTSPEAAAALGAALRPFAAGVALRAPEVEVQLKILDGRALAFGASTAGPGGLPIGTGGRAVALFSGGFDSPVAAWRVLRRGVELDFVVCDLGGCGQIVQAVGVAQVLARRWMPGFEAKVHVVDLAPVVTALVRHVHPRVRQILLKRAMYRAGAELARELRAEAIVTGESIAQVSTQTLRNLAVAESSISVPVLRPLIGMDKEETIATARTIGTHDASAAVKEYCAISTGRVETWARFGLVEAVEESLGSRDEAGTDAWVRRAVAHRQVLDLRTWTPAPADEDVAVEQVPEGAVVVDVREPEEGPVWGDLRIPMSAGPTAYERLDPGRTYVLVCSMGLRSQTLARALRERGVRAFSLAGGLGRARATATTKAGAPQG